MKFKNVTQLLDHFKDEATCRKHLEIKRWGNTTACHHCGSIHVYRTNRGFKCAEKLCGKKFTVLTGTVYENTKLPLRLWFAGIYLATSSKKGISSLQTARQLGITQKSAWFLNHRIREMLKEKAPQLLRGCVSVDECYIGGRERFKHKSKRQRRTKNDNYTHDKAPVIGLLQKDGAIVVHAMSWVSRKNVGKLIMKHIEPGSTMVTDSHSLYSFLKGSNYHHEIVNHLKEEYVNERGFSTNNVEGFFSLLKRGIVGIYHFVSPNHLQKYCTEFQARYNTRNIADDERFDISLRNADGKRLKYKDLIKHKLP